MTKATRISSVRNEHGVKVRKCCASCQHKEIDVDGIRSCKLTKELVGQKSRCKHWEMNDGLKNAGLSGGVVRLKGTAEIIIR